MSTFRNPVGPQPTNVYWRRRLVVGLGLLAVIVVILLIVFSPKGGGTPTGNKTDSSAPGDTSTPGSTAPPSDAAPCDNADLTVTAQTDKASYSTEESPVLTFTITNEGKAACMVTGGSDVQKWVISSGSEVYWDSTDCQADPKPSVVAVAAGDSASGGPLTWPRTRSDKDTCDDPPLSVPAGDATYSLTVTVNGVESKPVKLRLL